MLLFLLSIPKNLLYCYFYFLYPKNSAKIYYIVTITFYTLKIPQKSTIWQLLLSIPKNFRKNLLYFKFFSLTNFSLQNSTIVLLLLSIPKIFRKNLLYCYFYLLYPKNSTKIYYIENLSKKYYMATFDTLLLLFSKPKKFYHISTFTSYTQKIP